ncbi:hypothetical protein F3Y22_tig00113725pilonHSYRG01687 [Hibiscus syriacus]|uniref:RNase H type-1 domain-containing protein n=1 Tax=Hibiscus syriacus TaxID=106335 RepID=A0A6A2XTJ5_HIBSY|nr:hypothetical protein F3Y22_tig00113725pilonHSYRG01687 [Hibiscus syriacus]
MKIWSQLLSCLVWSVGNGDSINFRNDVWVPLLGPLCGYARANTHVHPTQKLHNFIDEQIHWDVEALSQVLVHTAIPHHNCKQRNDYVFKGATYKTDSTIHISYNWAKCYANSSKVPIIYPGQRATNPTWSPPPQGWMCLNMDGVVATLDGRDSIGGIICNSNGEWITGFTKNVRATSILHVELWSIYEGLLIARKLGIHKLWIQSDCSRAIKLVGESISIDSHVSLLRTIMKLRQSGCLVTKIQRIGMNGNKIADRMAKLALWQHFSLIHFDFPPDELAYLLALDATFAQQTNESIRA